MQKLQTILDKLLHNLDSLQAVMSEEQVQLCAGQINSSALQQVTEKKSSLLATMQYLEQCRHEEESLATLKAPYEGNEELAERWRQVQQLTKTCANRINIMVYCLISIFPTPIKRWRY